MTIFAAGRGGITRKKTAGGGGGSAPSITFLDHAFDLTNGTVYNFTVDVPGGTDDIIIVPVGGTLSGTTTVALSAISYNTGGSPVTPTAIRTLNDGTPATAGTCRCGIYHVNAPATGVGIGLSITFTLSMTIAMVGVFGVTGLGSFGTPVSATDLDGSAAGGGISLNLTTVAADSRIFLFNAARNGSSFPTAPLGTETEIFDDWSGTAANGNHSAWWAATLAAPTAQAYNGIGCSVAAAEPCHLVAVEVKKP